LDRQQGITGNGWKRARSFRNGKRRYEAPPGGEYAADRHHLMGEYRWTWWTLPRDSTWAPPSA